MAQFDIVREEEKILEFWKKNKIFQKSVSQRSRGRPFVFFEGPPTANGEPGIHHIIGRAFKDIILRYKTMRGHSIWRRAGWDTHGLPVEIEVEKELGLKSKKDIEEYGIARFNVKCKESVWRYKSEWEKLTERMGFWIDMEDPYITYEARYIENLWALFKRFWQKKLLFEDFKVVPYCVRCGTPISSHEVAQGYATVTDRSLYVKFKVREQENTYLLAWTTTPWTLPGNVALAVRDDIEYVKVRHGEEFYWFGKGARGVSYDKEKVIDTVKGKNLIGLEYEPLFDVPELKSEKSYKVYPADFVSTEEGTGIVHTAVMYGVEDFELGTNVGLPKVHTVKDDGTFTESVPIVGGRPIITGAKKDLETENLIIRELEIRNLLFKVENFEHEYPFCWRCGSPLLYYARRSWFVSTSRKRDDLIKANNKINWIPEHIKEGRFGEWLREVKDWAISRERYWGTPLPVWRCGECDHIEVIGSLDELNEKRAKKGTTFIFVRHGESVSNVAEIVSSGPNEPANGLTEKGIKEIKRAAKKLPKQIDVAYVSPLERARQTAQILAEHAQIKETRVAQELREVEFGELNGISRAEYFKFFESMGERFFKSPAGGETATNVKERIWNFLYQKSKQHKGETVLLVSHRLPIAIAATIMAGGSIEDANFRSFEESIQNGDLITEEFPNWPLNDRGEIDLHRPHIDEIFIRCEKCGGAMKRIPELADAWFDSGAMPFAQSAPKGSESKKKLGEPLKGQFPADYISEGIDQTRGWFYTLHAVSTLLGYGPAYKNVITYGHVLDKRGKKMSKSLGNVVSPWEVIEKYGIDALRWYFFTVNPPGEPKLFEVNDVGERYRKFVMTVINSLVFLETYWSENLTNIRDEKSVLDKWIESRLSQLAAGVADQLDDYDVTTAARTIDSFVQDLSNWYIRRSRDRFQNPDFTLERATAQGVLYETLAGLARIMAPLTPFLAEIIWLRLASLRYLPDESVHLTNWPEPSRRAYDKELEKTMAALRRIASIALAERAKAGIPVRQKLASMTLAKSYDSLLSGIEELLKDEVNVSDIFYRDGVEESVVRLDTSLTLALEREGILREIIRAVNDLRKKAGLTPVDKIELYLNAQRPNGSADDFSDRASDLKKETRADRIISKKETSLDEAREIEERGWKISLGIKKL